ncbi:hypothetical protein Tco_0888853 [Tanacetum coccineum]
MGTRGLVEVRVKRVTHPVMPEDTPEPAQEGALEVTYKTLRDLVKRFHDHIEAILVHLGYEHVAMNFNSSGISRTNRQEYLHVLGLVIINRYGQECLLYNQKNYLDMVFAASLAVLISKSVHKKQTTRYE